MSLRMRQWVWRLGRKAYMWARNDEPNHVLAGGELRLQRLVAATLRSDTRLVAFDVGARVGDWTRETVAAAGARPHGYVVHVFEPVPDSRQKIASTFAAEISRGDIVVNDVAVSDEAGVFSMYVPHYTAGTSTLHPDSSVRYEQVIQVSTITVAAYCLAHRIDQIDLLKVDTEGNDLKVVRGALDLLRQGRIGVLQFEYNHRWIYARAFLKDVFDLVRGAPYRIAKVCSDGLEIYADWHPELERFFETNYALVHERLVGPLGCRMVRIGHGNACEEDSSASHVGALEPSPSKSGPV